MAEMGHGIRFGSTTSQNPSEAIHEIYQQIGQEQIALVVLFMSADYDREQLTQAIQEHFYDTTVIGCTTAGEIGTHGYMAHGVSGFSLNPEHFYVSTHCYTDLQSLCISDWQKQTSELYYEHSQRRHKDSQANTFGLLLVDGLSIREEPLTRAIYNAIPHIPFIGGSAGDSLNFKQTLVFHRHAFHYNSAVFALIQTDLPFKTFYTQHFIRSDKRMVVTEADPSQRTVFEINGLPAAQEYARMVELPVEALTPMIFAAHPMVVRIGEHEYVRSIQKANPDGSLTFFCAIDVGIVFSVSHGIDMVENLKETLQTIESEIGTPELTIICDCILRSLELDQIESKTQVGEILNHYHSIGFNTYGEQFNGVHVNQTFTAIAIGDHTGNHDGEMGD